MNICTFAHETKFAGCVWKQKIRYSNKSVIQSAIWLFFSTIQMSFFSDWIITLDKTWIHHCTLEFIREFHECLEKDESRPKPIQRPTPYVLARIFGNLRSIILIYYLEKEKTVTKLYYTILYDRFITEIKRKK